MEKKYKCSIFVLVLFGLLTLSCQSQDISPTEIQESTERIGKGDTDIVVTDTPGSINMNTNTPETIGTTDRFQGTEVDNTLASLNGLSFEAFLDASYKEILLRDPEGITEYGLTRTFNIDNAALTNISLSYLQENYCLYQGVFDQLKSYAVSDLSREERLSYDIYSWYLEDLLAGEKYQFHDYPVTFFITAVQVDLEDLLIEFHPITDKKDAEDYIERLSQVDIKFDQLIEGIEKREALGVVPPKIVIEWTLGGIKQHAAAQPRNTPFYLGFEAKLRALSNIHPDETQLLLERAEEAIQVHVIPGYQNLLTILKRQYNSAGPDIGIGKLPDGEGYYQYLLEHFTTSRITPDEVHALGLRELERIHAEMRDAFNLLGYPEDLSLVEAFDRITQESGTLQDQEILRKYELLIQDAESQVKSAFDLLPSAPVIVKPDNYGGYYVAPSLDGSRPGAFYARVQGKLPVYGMPTLAYHETVPGHHLQIAVKGDLDLPLFRILKGFTGFSEGWALYAERLAWELGWYKNDIYGNLGRLQGEAFRAARLVVDTGIHIKGWTFDEAVSFFMENTGHDQDFATRQIARYVVWPGQATSYMIGMLKILELRQLAQVQLEENFDLVEFHRVVLTNGSLPLDVLEVVVGDYIQDKQ